MGQGSDVAGMSSDQYGAGASFGGGQGGGVAAVGPGGEGAQFNFANHQSIGEALAALAKNPEAMKMLGGAIKDAGTSFGAAQKSQEAAHQLGIPQLLERATRGSRHDFAAAPDVAQQLHPLVAADILRNMGIGS